MSRGPRPFFRQAIDALLTPGLISAETIRASLHTALHSDVLLEGGPYDGQLFTPSPSSASSGEIHVAKPYQPVMDWTATQATTLAIRGTYRRHPFDPGLQPWALGTTSRWLWHGWEDDPIIPAQLQSRPAATTATSWADPIGDLRRAIRELAASEHTAPPARPAPISTGRPDLDDFFARAEDVLTDWDGGPDAMHFEHGASDEAPDFDAQTWDYYGGQRRRPPGFRGGQLPPPVVRAEFRRYTQEAIARAFGFSLEELGIDPAAPPPIPFSLRRLLPPTATVIEEFPDIDRLRPGRRRLRITHADGQVSDYLADYQLRDHTWTITPIDSPT